MVATIEEGYNGGHYRGAQLYSSPLVLALLLAEKGNLPTLYSTPSSFSISSDLPTHPTSCKTGSKYPISARWCVYVTDWVSVDD